MKIPQLLKSKLKNCDSQIKKYIAKLENSISKLESDLDKLDLDNSLLRIENKRLNRRVNSLETELSKYTSMTKEQEDELQKRARETLKMLDDKIHE